MQIVQKAEDLRALLTRSRAMGMTVGFVPTMGNLHGGHLSLVEAARRDCDVVIVSIFVNPLQFGLNEDLDTYPRTLEADKRLLVDHGCDILFAPPVIEMYPDGNGLETLVDMPSLSSLHCGVSRPQFFRGVATVVVKLLCMVQPDMAYFGEKDRQQLTLIRQVTSDLSIPVKIIGVATKRAPSGLALSSRNHYLSDDERQLAASLYQVLIETGQRLSQGRTDFDKLESDAGARLVALGFELDYVHICQHARLSKAQADDQAIAILAAVMLNGIRLIDNIVFDLREAYPYMTEL